MIIRPDRSQPEWGRASTVVNRSLPLVALAGAILTASYVHIVIMRGTTFHVDEWTMIFQYGWSPAQLVEPINGHSAIVGRVSWNLVMAVFGIADYLPFRLLGLSFNLFLGLALFVYGRRRAGPIPALSLVILSLFLGSSFHTILWPAAAIGLCSIGALVLILLCLEREDLRSDLSASALMLLALASGGMGIVVYAASTTEILLRRQLRRWWLVVFPPLLYLAWLASVAQTRPQSGFSTKNIVSAPSYVATALRFAAAGLFGRKPPWATVALMTYLGVLALLAWLNRRRVDFVRVASLTVAPLTFWILTALFRGGLAEPGAPRYIAFGALPLALVLLEMARGLPLRRVATGALALAAVSVTGNLPMLLANGENFRHLGYVQRAELAALQSVRSTVKPDYVLPGDWARYIRADLYFAAVDRFGSPALDPARLVTALEGPGTFADEVMVAGGGVAVEASEAEHGCPAGPAHTQTDIHGGSVVTVVNRSGTLAELRLRRFGSGFRPEPWVTVPPGRAVEVSAIADRLPRLPWRLHSSVPVIECRRL